MPGQDGKPDQGAPPTSDTPEPAEPAEAPKEETPEEEPTRIAVTVHLPREDYIALRQEAAALGLPKRGGPAQIIRRAVKRHLYAVPIAVLSKKRLQEMLQGIINLYDEYTVEQGKTERLRLAISDIEERIKQLQEIAEAYKTRLGRPGTRSYIQHAKRIEAIKSQITLLNQDKTYIEQTLRRIEEEAHSPEATNQNGEAAEDDMERRIRSA